MIVVAVLQQTVDWIEGQEVDETDYFEMGFLKNFEVDLTSKRNLGDSSNLDCMFQKMD